MRNRIEVEEINNYLILSNRSGGFPSWSVMGLNLDGSYCYCFGKVSGFLEDGVKWAKTQKPYLEIDWKSIQNAFKGSKEVNKNLYEENQKINITASGRLAHLMAQDLSVTINPKTLRLFILANWSKVSMLAHAIHETKDD